MKVIEIFPSLQGEGIYVGAPTTFIRLSGCNMRCRWCDTEYGGGTEMDLGHILSEVEALPAKDICITGGEPLLQAKGVKKLIRALKDRGYWISVETNGSVYDEDIFTLADCISCDMKPPSSGERSDIKILGKLRDCDQVKVVIADDTDYAFAKEIEEKSCVPVIVQPHILSRAEWLARKAAQEGAGFRVIPQMHKLLGLR